MADLLSYVIRGVSAATLSTCYYMFYLIFKANFVYPGDFPEWGRDRLDAYTSGNGSLFTNILACTLGTYLFTLLCMAAFSKDLHDKSLAIRLLYLSYLLWGGAHMLWYTFGYVTTYAPWRLEGTG